MSLSPDSPTEMSKQSVEEETKPLASIPRKYASFQLLALTDDELLNSKLLHVVDGGALVGLSEGKVEGSIKCQSGVVFLYSHSTHPLPCVFLLKIVSTMVLYSSANNRVARHDSQSKQPLSNRCFISLKVVVQF